MALINGVVGLENVKDADLVIEAVFETMAVKKEVFGKLDQYAKPGAVLASNTSYLNIDEIAKETRRPQDVLGMHFFSPANVMKLCEIVRGGKQRRSAGHGGVDRAQDRQGAGGGRRLRRLCRQPPLAQRGKQSEKLLFEGALPQQVDAVVTKFGMPMGPFAMSESRRPRHRLALAERSRHQVGNRRRACASWPLRPEDRQGLLQI